MKRILTVALTGACAALIMLTGAHAAGAAGKTVKISGKAYVFNHMDTGISNATIKVRELPKIAATTDEFGEYELTVPNDVNATPYILSGEGLLTKRKFEDNSPDGQVQTHWNEVDLQTFHTRGADIENANFQSPADLEYAGLKAILNVPAREDGRPEQCAIVTTASARNVRGVDYHTFWENTPHGVPGATSIEYPAIDGPTYFNEFVIPDKTKTETSEDGGIVWPVVPTGTYRIATSSPDARFASFLATCKPGRVINASPPWGAYQLKRGERPQGASNVAGKIARARIVVSPVVVKPANRNLLGSRAVYLDIRTAEILKVRFKLVRRGRVVVKKPPRTIKPGERIFHGSIGRSVPPGKGRLVVRMTDRSGVTFKTTKFVKLQKIKKSKRR